MKLSKNPTPLSLDELIAFNDEVAALHHARLPLPEGLGVAAEAPGRVGARSAEIARRLKAGESLERIVSDESLGFGAFYSRLLRVGLTSGDFGWALDMARRVFEQRRQSREVFKLSALYSAVIYCLGTICLCIVLWTAVPEMINQFQEIRSVDHLFYHLVSWAHAARWIILFGMVMIGFVGVFGSVCFGGGPGGKKLLRWQRVAVQAEVLARLVEANVGVEEAVDLAAKLGVEERSAEARTAHSTGTRTAGTRTTGTRTTGTRTTGTTGLASALENLLRDSEHRADLPKRLNSLAFVYRERSEAYATRFSGVPMLASGTVGTCMVVALAVLVFLPWCKLLYDMGRYI